MNPSGLARLRTAKSALEHRLTKVIARTERSSAGERSSQMLIDAPSADVSLQAVDVRAFLGTQRVADVLEQGDLVEYWKSAPYLLNFMDVYAFKQALKEAVEDRDVMRLVRANPESFLDLGRARNYQTLESANPRLRGLLEETIDRGMWRLLWMPPAVGYYSLSGPFAALEPHKVTKRLVFSAWHMVPRAVASLLSYEAERRMMRADGTRAELKREDRAKQRGLLRFGSSEGRLTGLPLFLFVYPCVTFARQCDPRELARQSLLAADEVVVLFEVRIRHLVEALSIEHETNGVVDERWYWLVPMLLDIAGHPDIAGAWWERPNLAQDWAGIETAVGDEAWSRHVSEAAQTLAAFANRSLRLGRPPTDLYEVLSLAAASAPATVALRAFIRTAGSDVLSSSPLIKPAAQTGRAFLSLFNHAEVIEMIRAEFSEAPYWLRTLRYCHAGCLQGTLDEYSHLLRESLGCSDDPAPRDGGKNWHRAYWCTHPQNGIIACRRDYGSALCARAEDHEQVDAYAFRYAVWRRTERRRGSSRCGRRIRCYSKGAGSRRLQLAILAFCSCCSTSLGQEGLDILTYCHAITHWNLPSNPVDLEQREGRVHRFKGHAVRKNVAAEYSVEALGRPEADVWGAMFEIGRMKRSDEENDLVPFWLFPGRAKIERHVPAIPLAARLAVYTICVARSRYIEWFLVRFDRKI